MTGRNRVRWEFQAERGGKKAVSERCLVATEGERHEPPALDLCFLFGTRINLSNKIQLRLLPSKSGILSVI